MRWYAGILAAMIVTLGFALACSSETTPSDGDLDSDQEATDGDATDGDATDGDVTDGDAADGDAADGDAADGDVIDGDVVDGDSVDGDTTDGDLVDSDMVDGDSVDGDATDGDLTEFPLRVPRTASYTCVEEGFSSDWDDSDILCKIENTVLTIELYVQSNPIDCLFSAPIYETVGAWVKRDGAVSPIAATYDWGGRHHNDILVFTLDGNYYALGHSSIGWGWRACARPDCLVVCDSSSCDPMNAIGIVQDGCEREVGSGPPPLVAICAPIPPDGTLPELLDPWTAHDGQDDYPLLPCGGEDSFLD